jgi:hypothetical protein
MGEKTHYERVIGGSPEEKEVAIEDLQGVFDEADSELSQYELEKTEDEIEILKHTEAIVDRMVRYWGGNVKAIPLEKIYVLKPGAIEITSKGKSSGSAVHKGLRLNIGIEREPSKIAFASTLSHELFHLKSYKSAQVKESNGMTDSYRSGFSMVDRKNRNVPSGEEKVYFGNLEEAIVAECARKAFEEIKKEPMFHEEALANEKIKEWVLGSYSRSGLPEEKLKVIGREWKNIADAEKYVGEIESYFEREIDRSDYAHGLFERLLKEGKIETVERFSERERLYALCDEILEKSDGKFKDREEIFNEFAKANFTGNYLTVARIVEDALGKGSFRKLAEDFADKPGDV